MAAFIINKSDQSRSRQIC